MLITFIGYLKTNLENWVDGQASGIRLMLHLIHFCRVFELMSF